MMPWLLSALTMTYMWLLGNPKTARLAWLVCVIDNTLWGWWSLDSGNSGFFVLCVAYVAVAIRNFIHLSKGSTK